MAAQPPSRTVAEHAAVCALLQQAKRAEGAATGSSRRVAFRTTRSLIGAAHRLGFSQEALAEMLEVSTGSVRARTGPPLPVLPSTFLALIPEPTASLWAAGIRDPARGSEREVDVLELLRWYLRTVGVDHAV